LLAGAPAKKLPERNMRRIRGLTFLLVLLPGVAGGWIMHGMLPENGARLFAQVLQLVGREAIDGVSQDELYTRAARGLIDQLEDEYADLYSPQQLAAFSREQLGANYGGLGMQIEDQRGVVTVTRVFPGTPAERGGVMPGDRVMGVAGEPMEGVRLDEVSSRLIGTPGTKVDVTFSRSGVDELITGTFTRALVHVPAVPYTLIFNGTVGYIPLQKFNETATSEMRAAIQSLQARGAKSYVVDVRGNGGGSLEEALNISNLFLASGQEIARVEYRTRRPDVYTARDITVARDAPLVVLTDGYSASASEIVAGALQDHDRGLVVGTSSYGKGLVQQIFSLDSGWAMKLTTGKWYTPSGRSIQRDRDSTGTPVKSTLEPPRFQSDGGRPILGGGGITPDLLIEADTMSTVEQEFMRAVGSKSQQAYVMIYDLALKLRSGATADFTVRPEWRAELFEQFSAANVPVTREQFDAATPVVNRLIEQRLAGLAFGDSASFRRYAPHDAQLRTAIEILRQGSTQADVFAIAEKKQAAHKSN
jgi:carboxyl-terminal processing protease